MTADSATTTTQQVSLPQLGESVSGGTIVEWLVEPGDDVELDQPIAEISTDKVDTEIPSPVAGTVVRHLAEVDTEVAVGQPILEVSGVGDGGAPAAADGPGAADADGGAEGGHDHGDGADGGNEGWDDRGADGGHDRGADGGHDRGPRADGTPPPDGRLSPKVRRLLGEHGLEPSEVPGTGSGGRITPDDVERAAAQRTSPPSTTGGAWRGMRLSPLVKRLLREHDLDPTRLEGTGSDGRITPDDVRAAADRDAAPATSEPPAGAEPARAGVAAAAPPSGGPDAGTADTGAADSGAATRPTRSAPAATSDDRARVEPLSRTRKVIAERMLTSLQTTAQLTAAVEADVTRIMHTRAQIRDAARARYGFAPSPLAFAAKATCRALARHPVINASIDTEAGTVTYHRPVNLGIAVDTPNGLIVPVIHDAHELGVMALQERINDLAARAQDRQLQPGDVTGGTFTITNTGSGGTLFDTPILNPPEAAILATPRIEKRPVVVTDEAGNDSIAIRQRTYLCLSYDHRLIDGADAARFLTDLAAQLDDTDWEQELAELAG